MKFPSSYILIIILIICYPEKVFGQKDTISQNLASMIETLIDQDQFNGAVLYAKDWNILYEKYHGVEHPSKGRNISESSSFNLASVSKQFFGMSMMLLYEDSLLQFDDPVKKYLPDFPHSEVTIRHLVTHTSGLKEYFDDVGKSYSTNYTVENEDVYRTMILKDSLFNFHPGEKFQYSNTNYIFLAILIEKISSISIEEFLQRRIFDVIGLDNTFAYHLRRATFPENRVFGIEKRPSNIYLNDLTPMDGVIGDGNIYSTPRDLMKWMKALVSHQLVRSSTQVAAWTPQQLNNGEFSHYGFGWRIDEDTGHYVHTGGWVGFLTVIRFDPKTNELLVILNSNGNYESIVYGQNIFLKKEYKLPQYQLIENVKIVDGTGAPSFLGDVRLRNNRIYEIGELTNHVGEIVIDGNGKILCPGFIDSHSHHDRYYLQDRGMLPAISQGITTIIVGQDGGSHYPLDTFFNQLQRQPASINIGSYIGHNTLRLAVIGRDDFRRAATELEIDSMSLLLEESLDAGALGLSSGLEYDPGIYSNTYELMNLAATLAKNNSRYISHIRSEDRHLESAIQEIIDIGREADIPVQISHFKIAMSGKWGKAKEIIGWLQEARSEGIDITADIYPYTYWLSTLQVLMPQRDFDNYKSASYAMTEITPPEALLLSKYEANPDYVGKTIKEIAEAENEDPVKTYMRLIQQSIEQNADETVIGTSMTESDISQLMSWPYSNICSDGQGASLHPRGYGAFPRVLSKYVREESLFSIEEGIRKMTSLTAENMGITGRGMILPGYYADLVLLDAEAVKDNATVSQPHELSTGIVKVWVNGKLAYTDQKVTEERAGTIVKN